MPASVGFLDLIADRMIAALAREGDPFALSDALVFLPNQRARQGIADANVADGNDHSRPSVVLFRMNVTLGLGKDKETRRQGDRETGRQGDKETGSGL